MARGDHLGEFETLVLLAVVRLCEGAYGMTIRQEIEETTGREVSVPQVYVTLGRLEEKGLVASSTGETTPERGGRAKRFYTLEPEGAEALSETRAMMDAIWEGVDLSPWRA